MKVRALASEFAARPGVVPQQPRFGWCAMAFVYVRKNRGSSRYAVG